MTQLHHDDDPNSEQYVDGLRKANAELKAFADYVAKDLIYAEYSQYLGQWGVDLLRRYRALTKPANSSASQAPANTITIQLKDYWVHEVTGIPAGYQVRVEDYRDEDEGDKSHPSWDAEKECYVTILGGEGV